MNNDSLVLSKEDLINTLVSAFKMGVFSYVDLAEEKCLEIFNQLVEKKLKVDTNSVQINLQNSTQNVTATNSYLYDTTYVDFLRNWSAITSSTIN
jgi:hypothetical protein